MNAIRTLLGTGLALSLSATVSCMGKSDRLEKNDRAIDQTSTSNQTFLEQSEITPPPRSTMLTSVAKIDGCGSAPGVDGDPSEWVGEPTWIAGSARYDRGEWIWTDYPFDDDGTGAFLYPGEGEALVAEPDGIGKATPRQTRYGSNAADVTELRIAASDDLLRILIRFNFLNDVDTSVVGIGFDLDNDASSGLAQWPLGAKIKSAGLDLFLTAHGTCAFLDTPGGRQSIADVGGAIVVDTTQNVFEIAIPRKALEAANPKPSGAMSLAVVGGAGLWDAAAGTWMEVQAIPRVGPTNPNDLPRGKRLGADPNVFNLLFRFDEATTDACGNIASNIDVECAAATSRTFQTRRQWHTLQSGTTGIYRLPLDIGRLLSRSSDPMPLRRGDEKHFTRVYRSRINAEGVLVRGSDAIFYSRYQPYTVYVPACYETHCPELWPNQGAEGAPLVYVVHGGGDSHISAAPNPTVTEGGTSLYGGASTLQRMEERLAPIQVAALSRGKQPPWHRGLGEADILEVFDDAQQHYVIDASRRIIAGGSLGGYGTIRTAGLYPDLWNFAAAHCPGLFAGSTGAGFTGYVDNSMQPFLIDVLIPSLLNIPYRQVSGTLDPLTPIIGNRLIKDRAFAEGLDVGYTEYLLGSHCLDLAQANPWIDNHVADLVAAVDKPLDPNPARVRYRIDPRQYRGGDDFFIGVYDARDLGLNYDGAYWVSGLSLRPEVEALGVAADAPRGRDESVVAEIDVTSRARPGWQRMPHACGDSAGLGSGSGGNPALEPRSPTPHLWQCQAQDESAEPSENRIDLAVRNLARATLDLERAGLDTGAAIRISALGDGPFALTVTGLTVRAGLAASAAAGGCVVESLTSGSSGTELALNLDDRACTVTVTP